MQQVGMRLLVVPRGEGPNLWNHMVLQRVPIELDLDHWPAFARSFVRLTA